MKPATQYFIKAIFLEFLLTIITYNLASWWLDNPLNVSYYKANSTLLIGYLISLPPLLIIIYFLGERVNWAKQLKSFRRLLGVILQFLFLTLAVLFACCLILILDGENIHQISRIVLVVLYIFYIFGGIQTLLIGIWLGKKISEIE